MLLDAAQLLAVAGRENAINMRNATFHGSLSSEKKYLRAQQGEMLATSLRLHKLCSILLLKAAGFSGKVLNNEVLFGIKESCERRERYRLRFREADMKQYVVLPLHE